MRKQVTFLGIAFTSLLLFETPAWSYGYYNDDYDNNYGSYYNTSSDNYSYNNNDNSGDSDNYSYNNNNDGYHSRHYAERDGVPFATSIVAPGKKTIIVDPKLLSWAAYNPDGTLVRWGHASLGANYCPDIRRGCHTVTGTFTINDKGGPGCRSHEYPVRTHGGAPMAYCMHFYKGFAIHGSNEVPDYNASHGCVRVPVEEAQWLNQDFADVGTKVIIRPYGPNSTRYDYSANENNNYQAQGAYQTAYNNNGNYVNNSSSSESTISDYLERIYEAL